MARPCSVGGMMVLTKEELLCYNSMLDGKEIPEVSITLSNTDDDEVLNTAIEGLIKKGLLTENRRMHSFGLLPLKILQMYKSADAIVTIDNVRIGIDKSQYVSVLLPIQESNEYRIILSSKTEIVYALLELIPDLRLKYRPFQISNRKKATEEELKNIFEDYDFTNRLYFKKVKGGKVVYERLYYWKQGEAHYLSYEDGYIYDVDTGRLRREVLELLEIGVDE